MRYFDAWVNRWEDDGATIAPEALRAAERPISEEQVTMTQLGPLGAKFIDMKCKCVKNHTPVPLEVDLHHVFPQAIQIDLYSEVRDDERTPLCRTAHRNVHLALDAMLENRDVPDVNPYIRSVAREGFMRIVKARDAQRQAEAEAAVQSATV